MLFVSGFALQYMLQNCVLVALDRNKLCWWLLIEINCVLVAVDRNILCIGDC